MTFKCPEKYRVVIPEYGPGDATNGMFMVSLKNAQIVQVMASNGEGWEHISVSRKDRCPTWNEMCQVKDLFWDEDDCVVQYHPPKSDYVNLHPYCLHLWRPIRVEMPRPPKWMVG